MLKDPKQQRFFKTNDLFELFTLNEGEEEKTESSALFAGLNSDILPSDVSSKKSLDDSDRRKIKRKFKVPEISKKTRPGELSHNLSKISKPIREEYKIYPPKKFPVKDRSSSIAMNRNDNGTNKTCDAVKCSTDDPSFASLYPVINPSTSCQETTDDMKFSSKLNSINYPSIDVDDSKVEQNLSLFESNSSETTEHSDADRVPSESAVINKLDESTCQLSGFENKEEAGKPQIDEAKIEKMRMLAKMLSKKLTEPSSTIKQDSKVDKQKELHKSKKKVGKKFEGERICGLVKKRRVRNKEDDTKPEETEAQNDYVLSKLFKNSGVHTALSHDAIVGAGDPDYMLLQSEADRVAKDAMRALRASRSQCFRPSLTKTKSEIKRFGVEVSSSSKISSIDSFEDRGKSAKAAEDSGSGSSNAFCGASESSGIMSSSQLLMRMKSRNTRLVASDSEEDSNDEPDNEPPAQCTSVDPTTAANLDLLSDIRNFVAFQATVDGQASTNEILDKFKDRLPKEKTHVFKALLKQICDFRKDSSGKGMWYIKGEFQ